jgi:hypothetical protein
MSSICVLLSELFQVENHAKQEHYFILDVALCSEHSNKACHGNITGCYE